MAKSVPQLDVLVLGQHPCAYLAADMLCNGKPHVNVAHATIPGDSPPDRLILLNPDLFDLHKPLEKLKKKMELAPVWGCAFLSDDNANTRGEWRSKSATTPASYIGCYSDTRKHFSQMAKEAGVKLHSPKSLTIHHVDEKGFEIALDSHTVRPRAILLAGNISGENAKVLGLPEAFASDVMRRYSFLRLPKNAVKLEEKPMMPMSLDVGGKLTWAWMLIGQDEVQLAVEQASDDVPTSPPRSVMLLWAGSLRKHGILQVEPDALPLQKMESMDLPAAGALAREIVGNRTLLFGPAGGFYTACLEDLYPNCWSALFAADAIRGALGEIHLQDALQPYRQSWGTTLGEYLRGPQQNLRFLLPLVYRNPVMSGRLAESILQGKSVVR